MYIFYMYTIICTVAITYLDMYSKKYRLFDLTIDNICNAVKHINSPWP